MWAMPGVRLLRERPDLLTVWFACQRICSRRLLPFQSKACQVSGWDQHKLGCSPLPSGKLVAKVIAPDKEMDLANGTLSELLNEVMDAWSVSATSI